VSAGEEGGETVWEWKCTSHLTIDHFLQVVIYAWLLTTATPCCGEGGVLLGREFRIFNIKSGQMFRLGGTLEDWREVVVILLRKKYERAERMGDEDFLEGCKGYKGFNGFNGFNG